MECDEVDEDFVTPFSNKSKTKVGKDVVIYENQQVSFVVLIYLVPGRRGIYCLN